MCSYDQKQTTGGGILLSDAKQRNKVSYVAAQAFSGTYEITVRRLWGSPLFGQARVEVIEHLGTPQESRRLHILKLDQKKTLQVRLDEGSRTELAAISLANFRKRDLGSEDDLPVSGAEQLRRLTDPQLVGNGIRGGASAFGPAPAAVTLKAPGTGDTVPNLRTSVTPTIGASVNLEYRMSPDNRGYNVVMHPVFETLRVGRPTVNLSVVPGASR